MKKKDNGFLEEAAKQVYQDGLQDTVKESGKVLSLIPRTIHAVLSGLEKWILNKEYSIKTTQKMLEQKLSSFRPEEINEPDAYVAVPLINALSYSYGSEELMNLYANLLASSMLVSEKWKIHPSFVEIIKQLSPDEAKILYFLANHNGENEFPLIDLSMEKTSQEKFTVERYIYIRNFSNIGYGLCDFPHNISSYIDNLVRLNLIQICDSETVSNYDYSELENHEFIKTAIKDNKLRDGFVWEYNKFMFMITNFGKLFISVCVVEPKKES